MNRVIIAYTIGTFLVFPIVAYHILYYEDVAQRKGTDKPRGYTVQKLHKRCIFHKKGTLAKRNCGYAQKNEMNF